jgi:hypothetical protein
MGRNVKEVTVGVNGAIFRNAATLGPIIESDGAVYIPSTTKYTVGISDYPKYVGLNTTGTVGIAEDSVNPNSIKSGGIVQYSPTRILSMDGNSPYLQAINYHPALCGRRMKDRFLGWSAQSGNYVVLTPKRLGYRFNTGSATPAIVFNTATKNYVDRVCQYAYVAWYDSSTSTYRVVGHNSDNGTQPFIFTSSDAVNWSSTQIASTGSNSMRTSYGGDTSYYKHGSIISGQKIFLIMTAGSAPSEYTLFVSTNNGVTFTDRATSVSGSVSTYFSPSGYQEQVVYNYDGTTLFLGSTSPSAGRYSTNDGATFSNSTITGVTSSWDTNHWLTIHGGTASKFMLFYNSQVTSNRVFYTSNGGQSFVTTTWTPPVPQDSSYANMAGDYDSNTNTWLFIYQSTAGAYAARSTDDGTTWTYSKIDTKGTNSIPTVAYLDDAFYYHDNSQTLYRSVTGATWTAINGLIASPNGWAYGSPWFTLTDYIVFTNAIIRKSDQAVVLRWSSSLLGLGSRNFVGYLTNDYVVTITSGDTKYTHALSSATASSYTFFTNPIYSNQQTGTASYPDQIEYWRIK